MAGRVLIAATGELENSLSVNPSFSFFTKKYSKHTNYATENYKITFPEKVYTDDFLEVPIPQKYGDILRGVVLSFVADPTNVASIGSNLYPVDVFGISVIDYVELYVGEHKIDTVTGDDIFIDRELNVPESYRSSVNALHGNPFQGSAEPEFVQEFLDGQYNTRGIDPFTTDEYRIHIPFYFHRHPGSGFPLCSIYDQEMTIRIKLRPSIDVLFTTQNKLGDATLWDPEANNRVLQQLELSNFTVNLDLVHLDKPERCRLQSVPLNILFEQHQRNVFLIEARSKTGTFQLNFSNCVKELFFVAKKFGHWTQDQIAILNRIHDLDKLTSSQVGVITELRQSLYSISIWDEIIRIAMSKLTGVADSDTRKNIVDVLRQTILWGPEQLTLLTGLGDGTVDLQTTTTALIQYVYTIPNLIASTQTIVDTLLGTLPSITDTFARSNIIATLLAIQNVWGPDQIIILNNLIVPNGYNESLLIFQLRTFVSHFSYFLVGLSSLIPGSSEQLNVVNGLEGYLNDLTLQSDILKLGMIAVLNTLPNKTAIQRGVIVDGLIRIGAEATIWGSTQLELLELSRNPFTDTHITTLDTYLTGLLAGGVINQRVRIKGILFVLGEFPGTTEEARLERVTALRQFRVWRDEPIKLVNSLTSLTPGSAGRTAVINSLIEYSNVLIDEVPTLQFTLNNLKSGVNGILDTIATLTTTAERDPLIVELVALGVWGSDQLTTLNALRIPSANDTTYITQLKATSTQIPITQSIQNDIIQKLLTRNYWGDKLFTLNNLRLVVPGFIGQTALVAALNTYIAGLPDSLNLVTSLNAVVAATTQVVRDPIIDGLIALGVWSSAQIVTLNALRVPGFNDISTLIPEGNTRISILKIGFGATLDSLLPLGAVAREPIVDSLITLGTGIWGATELTTLDLLKTPSGNDQTYIDALKAFLAPIVTPKSIMLNSGVATTVRGFNFSNTYLTSNVITPLSASPLPSIVVNRNEFVSNLVAETGLWGSSQLTLLEELRSDTPTGYIDRLIEYVKGVLSTLAVGYVDKTAITLGAIDTKLNTNPLPSIIINRNDFVSNIQAITGVWGTEQNTLLTNLLTSTAPTTLTEQLTEYVNGILYQLLTPTTKIESELNTIITTLGTTPLPNVGPNRTTFIDGLVAETNVWGASQLTLLNDLRTTTPANHINRLIQYVKGILYDLLTGTDETESELNDINTTLATDPIPSIVGNRNEFVTNLEAITGVWGASQESLLNDLRTTTPANHINRLIQYVKGILYQLLTPTTKIESQLNDINTTLATDPLPPIVVNRNEFVSNLEAITDLWGASQEGLLNDLRTTTPTGHIDRLIEYVNGVSSTIVAGYVDRTAVVIQGIVDLLGDTLPSIIINRNDFVSNLEAIQNLWGADQLTLLNDLRTSDTSPTLITYVTAIRTTRIALNDESLDTTNRGVLINTLLEFLMWGSTQRTLLDVEFRVVGSQNHGAIVDGIVTYLGGLRTLATTYYNPSTGLGLLTTLLNTADGALHTTIVGLLQLAADTVWDGYFFRLLEELKNASIVAGTETTHISQLQDYVNITFFTAGLNRNIVFLLTQPTVRYPPSVFNKWARGKKHVPLMYSKQNKTTLECDGETIINETTGNNLFLSTSLSNIYHKRSPVFRNINMYSFALHPGELEPSGHMNFSAVKDARVTMNLEYDGSQGTFDFDDNFIEVLGIPQIDFPKQVIIIAKSYNMMIIRNGKAKVLF